MCKNKSPGIDGIPAELYQKFDYISDWLFNIYIKFIERKILTKTTRTAIVKFLHTQNDKKEIENYRPLSLICANYKIPDKTTAERIKPLLPQAVGNEQQGFILGGDISGNLLLVKEIIEYCNEDKIEAHMILMDFKKYTTE